MSKYTRIKCNIFQTTDFLIICIWNYSVHKILCLLCNSFSFIFELITYGTFVIICGTIWLRSMFDCVSDSLSPFLLLFVFLISKHYVVYFSNFRNVYNCLILRYTHNKNHYLLIFPDNDSLIIQPFIPSHNFRNSIRIIK